MIACSANVIDFHQKDSASKIPQNGISGVFLDLSLIMIAAFFNGNAIQIPLKFHVRVTYHHKKSYIWVKWSIENIFM